MRRNNPRRAATAVSLFPFLAVLLCTMGALIVMLMLVINQARAYADLEASQDTSQAEREERQRALQIQWEDHHWQAEVLQQQRDEIRQQMADQRTQLAHLEDHIRQLEDQWRVLQSQKDELEKLQTGEQQDAGRLAAELAALKNRLIATEQALDKARQAAAERPRSYAILPYPGPNGTERRPIYVECTAEGVVLRPENIVLRAEDFELLHSDNPLSAALRTTREYHARVHGDQQLQPYPLLIVRPSGVLAYVLAREAMSGWDEEFGYELVAADTLLAYPPPDPALAAEIQEAIRASRDRQAKLRRAMPSNPRASGFIVGDGRNRLVQLGPNGGSGSGVGVGSGSGGSNAMRESTATNLFADRGNDGRADARAAANRNSQPGGQPGAQGNAPAAADTGAPGGGGMSFKSMAQSRGSDWALQKQGTGTGYRRPVRVICERDALVLMPDAARPNDPPQVFRFEDDPLRTVDTLVQALHRRTEQWGLPPLGGYWRPQLVVQLGPDAGQRLQLVTQLLENSGLEIMRDAR